ncbi:hypothetical protein EDC04DRAFT_121018 [Pisolithus marmoratus]|nr:hypothetical protein EDC04DRAFT_121018 [Pisolithus marmoratus]
MPPPSSRHAQIQRREEYGALSQMQGNENTRSQSQQQHQQRTDPEQSSPQFIIHQRTQELLAQPTLSSTSSIDHQATAENRIGSASSRALMQSGSENRAGMSSTLQERPDHVGMPFVFGSVDDVFYGIPSSSIGQTMGKPNTGAGTGTATTTTHVGISASTSALDHQGQNMVSAPRAPSTRPSSPPGGFVDHAPQAPAASEGGEYWALVFLFLSVFLFFFSCGHQPSGEHSPEPNKDAVPCMPSGRAHVTCRNRGSYCGVCPVQNV